MFNAGKPEPRGSGLSVIGTDVTVTGNIATEGDLHIDGTVAGDIRCGAIVQGRTGRIVGGLVATSARLAGTVEGQVEVGSLTVQTGARIVGDAVYQTIMVETGAQVDGRMTHRDGDALDVPLRLVDASEPGN